MNQQPTTQALDLISKRLAEVRAELKSIEAGSGKNGVFPLARWDKLYREMVSLEQQSS